MTPEDRRDLLTLREQTETMIASAQRVIDALGRTGVDDENPTEFLQATKLLVERLRETLVFTDYVLSEDS